MSVSDFSFYLDFCLKWHLVDEQDLMWIVEKLPHPYPIFTLVHGRLLYKGEIIIYPVLIRYLITKGHWQLVAYLIKHPDLKTSDLMCLGEILTPRVLECYSISPQHLMQDYPKREEVWAQIWPEEFLVHQFKSLLK